MSLRLEMLQAARLARTSLGESAELVRGYLQAQIRAGGFANRAGSADLYYTVFGREAMAALEEGAEAPDPKAVDYLRGFGDGAQLGLVHLCCLARSWASTDVSCLDSARRRTILERIEGYRSGDGGYHATPASERGTIYGCFLAAGAYEDLDMAMPCGARMTDCVLSLRAEDGGFANEHGLRPGATPATAAAVAVLRHLRHGVPDGVVSWLLERCHRSGGFLAAAAAPMPDLLSTATALHALWSLRADFSAIREACLDFLDSLWSPRGGFHGSWTDEVLDVEYTYYGLLALGHLSR